MCHEVLYKNQLIILIYIIYTRLYFTFIRFIYKITVELANGA